MLTEDGYLTREEVATIYKVSTKTISRWYLTNKIPRPVYIGGAMRWRRSDIEKDMWKRR